MITLKSWGFKFGRPEANIMYDVSYLKNPWRDKIAIGSKKKILEYVSSQDGAMDLVESIARTLCVYDELFHGENLQVAICCSAGEYRSPAIVELVAEELSRAGVKHKIEQSKNSKI